MSKANQKSPEVAQAAPESPSPAVRPPDNQMAMTAYKHAIVGVIQAQEDFARTMRQAAAHQEARTEEIVQTLNACLAAMKEKPAPTNGVTHVPGK